MGFAAPFHGVQTAIFQERIAPECLGRVFSLSMSMMSLAMPIGLMLAGAFAEVIGVHTWFLISGLLVMLIALVMLSMPAIRITSYNVCYTKLLRSASKLAAEEFPQYDVNLRSAVSIARRLQDPLAELVKIDPKAIGVGQYQHDMPQKRLSETLEGVVEDCVNAVGVDVNTASPSLLKQVAGLNETLAKNIVSFRNNFV